MEEWSELDDSKLMRMKEIERLIWMKMLLWRLSMVPWRLGVDRRGERRRVRKGSPQIGQKSMRN